MAKIFKFPTWKQSDEYVLTIRTLWAFIAILLLVVGLLTIGWMGAPNRLRIYIPPDLSQGATVMPGQVPKNRVYAFTFQIFSAINTWSNSGTEDYKKNIYAYKNYLSQNFRRVLVADYDARAASGALGRQRLVSGVSGMGYNPQDVKILGDGTWLVDLHLKVQETVDGSVVKDVIMDYPLVVSSIHTSIQVNPWGLEITGYNKDPYRIKTEI